MIIKNVAIAYFSKSLRLESDVEGVCHKKALPWLSVVQSVEGTYDIKIGRGKTYHTKDGGFFVAPYLQHQTITHHISKTTGQMSYRWVYLDIRINNEYRLEDLVDIPVILTDDCASRMHEVFERVFSTDDPFEDFMLGFEIAKILYDAYGMEGTKKKKLQGKRMTGALTLIEEKYSEKLTVEMLAREVNLSASRFYAAFKQVFGVSPIKYVNDFRLAKAEQMLLFTDLTVSEVAASVGIDDAVYFNKLFKNRYRLPPAEYRKKNTLPETPTVLE